MQIADLYYMVNAASSELWEFWIGDTRSDPMARFTGIHLKDGGSR